MTLRHKYPSCKWALLKRFSRSEVSKVKVSEIKSTSAAEASFRPCDVEAHLFYIDSLYILELPRSKQGLSVAVRLPSVFTV